MKCQILESKDCIITSKYGLRTINGKKDFHHGIDIVKKGYQLDYIISHSEGMVTQLIDDKENNKGSGSYGNYVKIEHENGYSTLYAHMTKGLLVKKRQKVKKGQLIGYMGDSGDAYGKHLHFEVWKNDSRVDPTEYLSMDFYANDNQTKYKVGDMVEVDGIYVSSTSKIKLKPKILKGKITKIKDKVLNPYLLDNGQLGWANDKCIKLKIHNYLSNNSYKGNSIIDALEQINIDSSYENRSQIAKKNNIENYTGKAEENLKMLNMLKQGLLKS